MLLFPTGTQYPAGSPEYRISDRLRSTICCKQQCYAFVRQIAQSLDMSAALDFRKCKCLLLSSLAVSPKGFTPQAARCSASCKIPFRSIIKTRQISSGFYGGETGICSFLLQSNPCEIFLCFAKAFGQPLKTTHRVVFLTLSFESLLHSA